MRPSPRSRSELLPVFSCVTAAYGLCSSRAPTWLTYTTTTQYGSLGHCYHIAWRHSDTHTETVILSSHRPNENHRGPQFGSDVDGSALAQVAIHSKVLYAAEKVFRTTRLAEPKSNWSAKKGPAKWFFHCKIVALFSFIGKTGNSKAVHVRNHPEDHIRMVSRI